MKELLSGWSLLEVEWCHRQGWEGWRSLCFRAPVFSYTLAWSSPCTGVLLCVLWWHRAGDRNRKQEMVVCRTNDWCSDFSFSGYMVRVYYPPFEGEWLNYLITVKYEGNWCTHSGAKLWKPLHDFLHYSCHGTWWYSRWSGSTKQAVPSEKRAANLVWTWSVSKKGTIVVLATKVF